MAIFRYLGKYQAIPFSQVTTSAREHFQAIVCNCVRRQGFSIFFPKSNIARISELPFPPLHSIVASLAASFLKKSLDQQYDLFKCLSGYTGRRERRRLTNIIFCIIAHFLLFFFLQCLLRLDAMSVRKWRRLIKWCIVFANDRRFAVLSSYQS